KLEIPLENAKYQHYMKRYDGSLNKLKENLKLEGLPSETFMEVAYQAMQGLNSLHERNIAHGYIKLDNFFYLQKEDGIRVALGDLDGCVRVNDDGTIKSNYLTLSAPYAVDISYLRSADPKTLNFKYYDTYALFLSLVQLSLNEEDAIALKAIQTKLEKAFNEKAPNTQLNEIFKIRDDFI